jgi:hypothetical protein
MAYKVVINTYSNSFCLSVEAEKLFWERKLNKEIFVYEYNSETDDYTKVSDLTQIPEWNAHFTEEDYGENPDDLTELILARVERHDPVLVQVVEELGEKAGGEISKLKVIEIPYPVYKIIKCIGGESVRTPFEDDDWTVIKEEQK